MVTNNNVIDSSTAKGWLNPTGGNPNPIGTDNYTKDFFKFAVVGTGAVNLTLNAGGQWLQDGVASPGMTFRGSFNILDSVGNIVATGSEGLSTFTSNWSGNLAVGDYTVETFNYGGMTSNEDSLASYFTSGSYFYTGSIEAVPEPATMAAMAFGLLALARKRRSKK